MPIFNVCYMVYCTYNNVFLYCIKKYKKSLVTGIKVCLKNNGDLCVVNCPALFIFVNKFNPEYSLKF